MGRGLRRVGPAVAGPYPKLGEGIEAGPSRAPFAKLGRGVSQPKYFFCEAAFAVLLHDGSLHSTRLAFARHPLPMGYEIHTIYGSG